MNKKYEVRDSIDVFEPRRAIQTLGAKLGFSRGGCQELAIVVSELASNIVKYGKSGSVEFGETHDEHGAGVWIVARDIGPPFRNLEVALQDGCDENGPIDPALLLRRKGIGAGLGAVVRLTDSFAVHQNPGEKEVRTVRYLKRPKKRPPSRFPR
jgi:anti-sigma regulatory factor (Ser/Thr protein kinase)